MDNIQIVEFLTSVELFDDFEHQEIAALAELFEATTLAAGDQLMIEGDESDSFHVVVQGRLRAVTQTDDGVRRRGEIGRGEPIGEMGLLTGSPRSATVVAVRDSEILTMPGLRFDELVASHPGLLRKLAASIIQRSNDEVTRPASSAPISILVVAIDETAETQLASLTAGLSTALKALGDRVAVLTDSDDEEDLLPMERDNDRVILTCGLNANRARADLAKVADTVLLFATRPPIASSTFSATVVKTLAAVGNMELVVNHPPGVDPVNTRQVLGSMRDLGLKIRRHHHVSAETERGVARVARLTTQRGVGLVLGGGGARGLAHIGVIDALIARAVPIDAIIGTSAGAIVAADFGNGYDRDRQIQLLVDHLTRSPMDYTIPSASLAGGRRITELCQQKYGDSQIEDLWIDTTAVSTNLTQDCITVHDSGPLWRAVRASVSIPVLFPPMRIDDDIHVDGALGANVPVGPISERHPGITVVASDVGIDKTMGAHQLSDRGVTTIRAGIKQWVPLLKPEGPSVIRLIGRMVELSTGYGDQTEPSLLIKHELNDLPLFGFDRGFETAERGRVIADAALADFLATTDHPWMSA